MIVVFSESKNVGTWRLFTFWRKKFGHCFIVDYDPDVDCWMKAECASQRMSFTMYKDKDADLLIGGLTRDAICLNATGEKRAVYFPRWLYCVSFVKHFLGMRKWWILTPYQLYCELRKEGCDFIFTESEELN